MCNLAHDIQTHAGCLSPNTDNTDFGSALEPDFRAGRDSYVAVFVARHAQPVTLLAGCI
ncbi:hypothetical protein K439DRAFT_1638123, partial [Ramaria rubella]